MIRPTVALYSRPNASPAFRLRSLYQRRADRSSRAASGWTRSLSVGFIGIDEPLSFVPRERGHTAAVCLGQSPCDPVLDGLEDDLRAAPLPSRLTGNSPAISARSSSGSFRSLFDHLAGRATRNDHSTQRGGPPQLAQGPPPHPENRIVPNASA